MDDGITIKTTPKPKDRRNRTSGFRRKQSIKERNRPINPDDPMEQKYQGIRGYHMGRWKTDSKMRFRVLSMVSKAEYLASKDGKDIMKTHSNLETLYELAKTRDVAKQEALLRYGKKGNKLTATRNETIAKFVTGFKGQLPHSFVRYDGLIAKNKRRAKPRPLSSKGKVNPTTVQGFDTFNKDYKMLTRSLLKLYKLGKGNTRSTAKKLAKQFRITVK